MISSAKYFPKIARDVGKHEFLADNNRHGDEALEAADDE
jgi:hypothetical protein